MPSITIWSRLEPRVREFTMARALQAQLRDPLWLLGRQWQIGEFLGDDAGSPVKADVRATSIALTGYRGPADETYDGLDRVPLEVRVEREDPALGLGGAVQLGLRFEELLDDEGAGSNAPAFRTEYSIGTAPSAGEIPDAASRRLRAVVAGRVLDGNELVAAGLANAADLSQTPPIPALPTAPDRSAATRALERLLAHRSALFSEPSGNSAWLPRDLEFSFGVASEGADETVTLDAPEFRGGALDWYSFTSAATGAGAEGGAAPTEETFAFIPNGVSFRGMPSSRWWNFEDAVTDFGKLDAEHVDLAKMILMEFALVYGDDWFELPLALPVGSLSRIELLLVTDTFGERTLIEPANREDDESGTRWSMFTLSGPPEVSDFLLLAPTLDVILDGPELEDVVFLRDEMAAMGWAIERELQGALDAPVDGYASYRERIAANPPPPLRARTPDGPAIEYIVGTEVPDNWIPLVPVQTTARSFVFRRGVMGSPGAQPARGRVLEPWHPFYLHDEAVPREGAEVSRRVRRARWVDGTTWVWMSRAARVGRGPGWSGLEFDVVRELGPPP